MNTSCYALTQIGFAAFTFVFYGLAMLELKSGLGKTAFPAERKKKILGGTIIALLTWMAFISILALGGFFTDFSSLPPRIGIVLIIPLVALIAVCFSKTAKEILLHIPPQNLVRLQVLRVGVEFLLWGLFIQKLLPVQMTFEGRNFDVLTGLSAPIMAYLIHRNKMRKIGLAAWNLLGLALLFNIAGIAVLSMPTPLRLFMNEPANTIVAEFPIIWLPGFLVPLAYGLHFLSLRQSGLRK